MEISISDIISIVGLLAGGGGIGCWFTWRYSRRKEKAEAEQAETSAAKEMQDMYQQLIDDVKKDRADQREYITELKSERNHLRQDRDTLRDRLDKVDDEMRALKREVARNGRQVEALRPFICADLRCANRQRVAIPDLETSKEE